MNSTFTHAPHRGDAGPVQATAPNAALLIDFDNVTMGMRSDLSKDLRKLLDSEVIRGKVTVQRAYADWRRYPQYIVPLSENSIDLIFAPAYGSSKKNATDIRMAIDGMELVFTRPEIGTYILLTGDSDFSSLVLKLKEYGKYVIGVGIQESSSDILVQNCDEYYSYTNLAGLQKTDEAGQKALDPWVLVEKSVKRMDERNDVMRSDRLKQVMIEIDPVFDEGNFGFSKFSKFLTEAASRGLVKLKKMENGQYEITTGAGSATSSRGPSTGGGDGRDSRSKRSDERGRRRSGGRSGSGTESRGGESRSRAPETRERGGREAAAADSGEPMKDAYGLLRAALTRLAADGRDPVRDSDVKRKMLEDDRGFDESELGFSKFSLFLQQAHEDDVVVLNRRDSGNYEVSLVDRQADEPATSRDRSGEDRTDRTDRSMSEPKTAPQPEPSAPSAEKASSAKPRESQQPRGSQRNAEKVTSSRRLGPRRGSTRRRSGVDDAPSLFEGQVVSVDGDSASEEKDSGPEGGRGAEETSAQGTPWSTPPGTPQESAPTGRQSQALAPSRAAGGELDLAELGLPTDADAAKRYLANSYKGVGVKTAETLVDALGEDVFNVLHAEPGRVHDLIPSNRAETVIDAWQDDLRRRRDDASAGGESSGSGSSGGRSGGRSSGGGSRRTRRGGRR